ncbi:hypothetical protein LWI29_015818 [Acer saccharum]|uniref:Uncharacterized protein n=1 Tax=Acer saccharum TaxID=4024 RepID=A0AA39RPW2_ACESA|nr:hypothetical protein LWI29_015818 [Acer saccharum]
MSYDETNGFENPTSSCQPMFKSFEKEKKELLKVCEDVMHSNRVMMSKMEELKEGNARLQEKIEETSREKEEMREEFEKKLQLMKKEFESESALEMEKANKLQELNKKLVLEIMTLRVENGTLKKMNGEVSKQNLARLFEEFEEKCARMTRKLLMEKEQKVKVLEETNEALGRKDEALKIAKVKECDYIVHLDKVEKEVKVLQMKQHQRLHSHLPRGSFLNHPPTCYFCFQKGHSKTHCFKFHKHEKLRKSRNRKKPPRVKQIWVRKDLVNQVRPKRKEKGKSTQLVWVVKKDQFPNLVKPPLVDDTPSTST